MLTHSVCRGSSPIIIPQKRINYFQVFQPCGPSLCEAGGGVAGQEGQEHPQGPQGEHGVTVWHSCRGLRLYLNFELNLK